MLLYVIFGQNHYLKGDLHNKTRLLTFEEIRHLDYINKLKRK